MKKPINPINPDFLVRDYPDAPEWHGTADVPLPDPPATRITIDEACRLALEALQDAEARRQEACEREGAYWKAMGEEDD